MILSKTSDFKIHSNLYKLLIFKVLSNFFLIVPVMVLFWQENGLNLTQITILQALYSISVIIMQVPTGALADIYGRKFSIALGSFLAVIGLAVYATGYGFFQFLIAEITFGAGMSFVSGADSALLYETLLQEKKENFYKKISGNILALSLLSGACSSILGGFVGSYNLRLALSIQVPIYFLAFLIASTLREPIVERAVVKTGYLKHMAQSLRFSLVENKEIRLLVLYASLIGVIGIVSVWFYQPYMKLAGLDIAYFGFVYAMYNIIASLSSKYAHQIENSIGKKFALVAPLVCSVSGFLLFGNILWIYGFSFGFLLQFVRGFATPVIEDYIHKITSSDKRATIMSISGMVGRLMYAVIGPFVGYVADIYSLQQAFTLSGIILLISGIILLLLMKKHKVFKEFNHAA